MRWKGTKNLGRKIWEIEMKLYYKPSNKITIEVDAETPKALHEKGAQVMELVENCGKCGSDDVKFQVRKVDKYKYPELVCRKCGAVLGFGTHEDGGDTLFPVRYEKDDKGRPKMNAEGDKVWLNDKGWTKWNAKLKKRE